MFTRLISVCVWVALGSVAVAQDPTLKSIKFGTHVLGKKLTAEDLEGKVVLVVQWAMGNNTSTDLLPTLARWDNDWADGGFVLLGLQMYNGSLAERVRAKCREYGVHFPVTTAGSVDGVGGGSPHCLLFDHTGKVLFEGPPLKGEPKVRAAIVGLWTDDLGETPTKAISTVFDGFKKGTVSDVYKKWAALSTDPDARTAKQAKTLAAKYQTNGQARLDDLKAVMKDDAITAYDVATGLTTRWKGYAVGKAAGEIADKLKGDKPVAAELKARPTLEKVYAVEAGIRRAIQDMKFPPERAPEPASAEYKKLFAGPLKQIDQTVTAMKKSYPDAPATKEAEELAKKLGAGGGK